MDQIVLKTIKFKHPFEHVIEIPQLLRNPGLHNICNRQSRILTPDTMISLEYEVSQY